MAAGKQCARGITKVYSGFESKLAQIYRKRADAGDQVSDWTDRLTGDTHQKRVGCVSETKAFASIADQQIAVVDALPGAIRGNDATRRASIAAGKSEGALGMLGFDVRQNPKTLNVRGAQAYIAGRRICREIGGSIAD